jgi:putative thioredoxin
MKAGANLKPAALEMLIEASEATAELTEAGPLRQALSADPGDSALRLRLAQWQMSRGQWQAAMDSLLELVRRDRSYRNDAGRRGLLAAFELCDDDGLVRDYRRRLSADLH